MFHLLKKLYGVIERRRKFQLAFLVFVMVVASVFEVISVGAVVPLIGILTSPEAFIHTALGGRLAEAMQIGRPRELLLPITVLFALAALLAGMVRTFMVWLSTKISFGIGLELSSRIYLNTLRQPYAVHVMRNSSEVIAGVVSKADSVIYNSIYPLITIVSSVILVILVMAALFAIDPVVAAIVFLGIGGVYAVIMVLTKKRLSRIGEVISSHQARRVKVVQEGLGGIRDIILDSTHDLYGDIYEKIDRPLRDAQRHSSFLANVPRYGIETLALILFSSVAYWLTSKEGGTGSVVPVLAATALGAQRIMPSLQSAYHSWTFILSGSASLRDVLILLDRKEAIVPSGARTAALPFRKELVLRDVQFKYAPHLPPVISRLNLEIKKGDRIGLIGATGSGKSTVMDIVMGLLELSGGSMFVDGVKLDRTNLAGWQRGIAHVPQAIFLTDASIRENIAFGVPPEQIDQAKVVEAATKARLVETIEALPLKYDTPVGERGVQLSGGQRQRIGIARALYKSSEVIVLDEATSALDNETEQAVMQSISDLGHTVTIFVIAHRLTTLKMCDRVIEIGRGGVLRSGSYRDMIGA